MLSSVNNLYAIPGGGPQGGTDLLFDLQVNLAGFLCPITPTLPIGTFGPEQNPNVVGPLTLPLWHRKEKTLKKKYVDDLSMLEAVDLLADLVPLPVMIGPPNKHEVPGLALPLERSILQHQLADLLSFTESNKMKINFKKTKILPLNPTKNSPSLAFLTMRPLKLFMKPGC